MKLAKYNVPFKDFDLTMVDVHGSKAIKMVYEELKHDSYGVDHIDFKEGDTVVDIGANIGLVSLYLARKFPFIKVIAIEPFGINYDNLNENVKLNKVENISTQRVATSSDARDIKLSGNIKDNSGGVTGCLSNPDMKGQTTEVVPSKTLDELFDQYHIKECKLLKMDCEGMEHEILLNTKVLTRVENFVGEFHLNSNLEKQGYGFKRLVDYCLKYIDQDKFFISGIRMAE